MKPMLLMTTMLVGVLWAQSPMEQKEPAPAPETPAVFMPTPAQTSGLPQSSASSSQASQTPPIEQKSPVAPSSNQGQSASSQASTPPPPPTQNPASGPSATPSQNSGALTGTSAQPQPTASTQQQQPSTPSTPPSTQPSAPAGKSASLSEAPASGSTQPSSPAEKAEPSSPPEESRNIQGTNALSNGEQTQASSQASAETVSAGTSAAAKASSEGGEGESASLGFSGSIALGMVTVDGEQVNRISFRPELTFGPLGVALDLELFISSDGRLMRKGWEFGNRDDAINSLYRKIYYIRWNHPGDAFYARVGALEGITMDAAALITDNWGNVAQYPGQKLVGVHVQFNDWFEPMGFSLEVANNSLEDWNHDGGVVATKASIKPLGVTGIPVLSNLRIGAMIARDFNQYATVGDRDKDGCPDMLDDAKNDDKRCKYLKSFIDPEKLEDYYQNNPGSVVTEVLDPAATERDAIEEQIKKQFEDGDDFTLIGLDYQMPLFRSSLFDWDIYGEFARPWVDKEDDGIDLNDSWALVPVGTSIRLWRLTAGLEYRQIKGRFQTGHFDDAYEMERVRYVDGEYQTKEESYWRQIPDRGMQKGLYGRAAIDLGGFIIPEGSYYYMWGDDKTTDQGYEIRASLGQTLLGMIPKISLVEAYFSKDHLYTDGDDFFTLSIYTIHGYRVGLDMGGGVTMIVGGMTTYSRNDQGKLEPSSNFVAEAVVSF